MKRFVSLCLIISTMTVQAQLEGMIDLHVYNAPDN